MDASDMDRVLGAGSCHRVGSFRFTLRGQQWEWSDEVAAMHGYPPATVTPTTELLLSHKHPDDRAEVAATLAETVEKGAPFCSRHRIVDTTGHTRHVLVVADQEVDKDGELVGTAGFYVELDSETELDNDTQQAESQGTLADIVRSRAAIEQAKGALMLVYGISADRAFDVLTWRSQASNVKIRLLAQQLVAEFTEAVNAPSGLRSVFDHLLLTVHERIPHDLERPTA
ncbi:PAS and ANTAR domain-containing protein [Rhodococcus sp. Q]|uniref:PAS and ANTAR domain-containing protein n=1 Tax=Rhodococcus sp. Q TaxID=2502252 RepID=UPI0010F6A083|nr:PAS and ANTAR domain-containing protein [Rhodococcus sp. Q]